MVDVLETATGARRQPLLFEITTAGYDRHSICFEHHDYSIKVLEGTVPDELVQASSPQRTTMTTGPTQGSGTRPTRISASRSRRTISRARPRRSPCPARRTRSGACISMSGPSKPSAGSTWRPGTPVLIRSSSSCSAGVLLRRPRPLDHHRRHRARLGVPARGRAWALARALALLRAGSTCASAPSATVCPTTSGPARASSRRPRATSSTTARSSSGSSRMPPCSRSTRSPTTPGTRPTSPCASRTRGR